MNTVTLQYALDVLEKLPFEEQEMVIDIVKKRRIEDRREEIRKTADELSKSIADGKARFGSIEDLKNDLMNDK